jgi:hypothetical protein
VAQLRPLPPYDASYGLRPANDLTNDDLLKRYGVTKPTLFKRRDALVDNKWITPEKVGPRIYYSPQDVHLLDQCSWWVSKGYTVPEVVAHLKQQEKAFKSSEGRYQEGWDAAENAFTSADVVGAVDVEAENSTTELIIRGVQASTRDLQVLGDEVISRLAKAVEDGVRRALPKDNLSVYDFLTKAADKNYLLTSKVLADGLGVKSSTVNSWPDESDRLGFRLIRIAKGNYRVRPLTDEEIIAAAVQQVDMKAMRESMRAALESGDNSPKQGAA